jgi:hypothetical protein
MTKEEEIEGRKNWRYRWLGSIFLFAHLEYQKGLWFSQKYPDEVGWLGEDLCRYFDDLHLYDNYTYQIEHGAISTQEYLIVKLFHIELDKFSEKINGQELDFANKKILKNREWIEICEHARNAWDGLKEELSDSAEKAHMLGLEKNYLEEI